MNKCDRNAIHSWSPLAVDCRNVRLSYGKGIHALNGVDLAVPVGKIYGLLGPR